MRTRIRHVILPGVVAALVLVFAAGASAQYFGQNKVQYKRLDFQILRTEHFDLYFYPAEKPGIDIVARLAERWHERLTRLFDHELRGRQPVVMYASHPDFEQNNVISGVLGEGTGGVTEPLRRRIVMPFGGPLEDTDHVLGHELVHAFQFDVTTNPNAPPGQSGLNRLPLWFVEGMAEYLSLGPVDANTSMWLRDAVRQNKLPDVGDLADPEYFPYRWGHAFWAYVGGRWGDEVVARMLRIGGGAGVDAAIETVLGMNAETLTSEWHAAIREAFQPGAGAGRPSNEVGRVLITTQRLGEDLNVGPALSPDGRRLAFLSGRAVFSIDLYVADAATGEILHKLTSTATDPHYSSLQFIESAGAWDAASTRLAVGAISGGRPALAIFDAVRGRREREIAIRDVDEILNPTWAPDGGAIAFTAMTGGLTDLFVYDLGTSALRRLTNDAFAELQPVWSPDGQRIAFTTDRFSTRLETLQIGEYRLATLDVKGGAIQAVNAPTGGKQINPQWSADSRSLYFISDRDGVANLYRVELASGNLTQFTRLETGISGITASSPALSVATQTETAAFSLYTDGKYPIVSLDLRSERGFAAAAEAAPAVLPPLQRRSSEVAELLADATLGLPTAPAQEVVDYSSKLTLEAVGQPVVAFGASRFGPAFGGGVSFSFSDMLGNHNLVTAVQFNSGFGGGASVKDLAVQAGYFNQARRWNWGLIGGQVPYLSGGFQSGVIVDQGRVLGVDETIIFRQTERSAAGIVAYPFDRARRVEFQGGISQISFDQIVERTVYDPFSGVVLDNNRTTTSLGDALTLGNTSAAFVGDTSSFGATSPVAGQRYRFEVAPTFGSISYAGVLADYRRYFMPAPFYTLAARVMHYGRYGTGGDDSRLFPLYLGYPTLVRGYDVNSFDSSDCVATAASQCPALDRLLGSRMLVGNLEFRFPLLRPFGASSAMYGPVPVEVALFADGGLAWTRDDTPSFAGGSRDGVGSAGVAFRVNLFGFAIGEFDIVRPFQRPGQGWLFQFNLAPGF